MNKKHTKQFPADNNQAHERPNQGLHFKSLSSQGFESMPQINDLQDSADVFPSFLSNEPEIAPQVNKPSVELRAPIVKAISQSDRVAADHHQQPSNSNGAARAFNMEAPGLDSQGLYSRPVQPSYTSFDDALSNYSSQEEDPLDNVAQSGLEKPEEVFKVTNLNAACDWNVKESEHQDASYPEQAAPKNVFFEDSEGHASPSLELEQPKSEKLNGTSETFIAQADLPPSRNQNATDTYNEERFDMELEQPRVYSQQPRQDHDSASPRIQTNGSANAEVFQSETSFPAAGSVQANSATKTADNSDRGLRANGAYHLSNTAFKPDVFEERRIAPKKANVAPMAVPSSQPDANEKLIVAVSSRALFNLDKSNEIFEKHGVEAYREHQIENEDTVLEEGVAFTLVKKMLRLNEVVGRSCVEVILVSRNSADTGLRVFNSIEQHRLDIKRAIFTSGAPNFHYISAFNANLFLSANIEDAQNANKAGIAAAMVPDLRSHHVQSAKANDNQIRIAFDGDAVLFSGESEHRYQQHGLDEFNDHEQRNAKVPLSKGPLYGFLMAILGLQSTLPADQNFLRLAMVTARGAPSHKRVIHTLRDWGVTLDEVFFLASNDKTSVLAQFGADFFFDDKSENIQSANARQIPAGQVVGF